MKRSLEVDAADLTAIMEGFEKKLDTLSNADMIDLAARLKPVAKHCESIDKYVKDRVKIKLKHKEGALLGDAFKAVLTLVKVTRLDQKAFKEAEPDMFDEYSKEATDERITFEVR